jgi:hypothetical protein
MTHTPIRLAGVGSRVHATSFISRIVTATDCPVSEAVWLSRQIHPDFHDSAISQLVFGETIDDVANGPLAMNFKSAFWSLRQVVKGWFR